MIDREQAEDEKWMGAALGLARRSEGLASPNPMVGCVLVRNEKNIGQGWHEYARRDHAEVVALAQAGDHARGATAYVTLEPCSHQGRTGPCADALIRAGVARVVAATTDPNPLVSGRGLAKLRDAEIEVVTGVMQEPARRLNDAFAKYIHTGLPLVTLKAALSLDGRIAPAHSLRSTEASPFWLTGEQSRVRVQQLRHASDAILTGINTILDDDPLLTDRTGLSRRRPLLRVVLDSGLRLPPTSKLVRSANKDVLVFCTRPDPGRRETLEAAGVLVEILDPDPAQDGVSLEQVLARLGELQITSLIIEAGAQTNTSALHQHLVDRLALFYAPTPLGSAALPLAHAIADETLANPRDLMDLFHINRVREERIGHDMLYEGGRNDLWDLKPE